MKLPKLYKKTSTGATQYWEIEHNGASIITRYGQEGGKEQVSTDVIKSGKNIGRSNETTPEYQAELETKAQWESKIKKGYVEDINKAKNGETNIEGGWLPMLAHKFSEQGHKIVYPAYVQPKLDGHRCVTDSRANLWSRTRKPINGVPHISTDIKEAFIGYSPSPGYPKLDGELYNHELRADFEKIAHFVRQETPQDGADIVQYHIYDMVHPTDLSFADRYGWLKTNLPESKFLKLVETIKVDNEAEAIEAFEYYLNIGYEGAIIRNANAKYEHKRSYNLQKIKEFDDAEFLVVGIEEGRGKLAGHVGCFVCTTPEGVTFGAKAKGELSKLEEYFNNHSLWEGKMLTVQYQGFTGKNNVPRFPVGVRFP